MVRFWRLEALTGMATMDGSESDAHDLPAQKAGGQYFFDPGVDRLVAVVLNLAAELWSQKQHVRSLDGLSADNEKTQDDLKAFIDRIFEPLRER